MARVDFNNLQAFITVARERSFTRAAAQIGVTQSALSHTIRGLEERMGIRLLARTTRGVSPTEAGERLLANIAHHYDGIEFELSALSALREKPAGTIRLTAHDHAVDTIVWPRLQPLLRDYPDIRIEIGIHYGLIDIVAERFDAGVRRGDRVARDMIAVRIGPDQRMAAIAAPGYLAGREPPLLPQDLARHDCINLRLPTHGGLYAWEFARDGKQVEVHVQGRLVMNTAPHMLQAALAGHGIAYIPEDLAQPHMAKGDLMPVLQDWWPTVPGYHLYYPNRRQQAPAFSLFVAALRWSP
ncbi:MAG TPA: LysR family transcriptional regulator [Burkholderiaceae bacterium]